jgi:hypothetical protein
MLTSWSKHSFVFLNFIYVIPLFDKGFLSKRRTMETTTKNHSFCSAQLKEMADRLEGCRVRNLAHYQQAARNTEGARDTLMSLIQDDASPQRVLSQRRYDSMVESGMKFLQEKRRCEKERLE